MDSMRNLHRSLPGSTPRHKKKRPSPPEDLLQTFKAAALSVTSLYKRAAEELSAERQAGYQDALYDLLYLLDKENIGLETGEGWRVRQWATEKQDTGAPVQDGSDEEDEKDEEKDDEREEASHPVEEGDVRESEKQADESAKPTNQSCPENLTPVQSRDAHHPPRADNFTFQSSHSYPENVEMDGASRSSPTRSQPPSRSSNGSRPVRRHVQTPRSTARHRHLGAGAGTKRKVLLNDFFDLSNLNFGSNTSGPNSKRTRPL